MDVHLALSCQNFPKTSLQIDVVYELKWTNICHWFVTFFTTWVIGWPLNHPKCFLRSKPTFFSRPTRSCQNCPNYCSQNVKKCHKILLIILSIINKTYNWEFCSCRNVYQGGQVAPQPKTSQNGSQNAKKIQNVYLVPALDNYPSRWTSCHVYILCIIYMCHANINMYVNTYINIRLYSLLCMHKYVHIYIDI